LAITTLKTCTNIELRSMLRQQSLIVTTVCKFRTSKSSSLKKISKSILINYLDVKVIAHCNRPSCSHWLRSDTFVALLHS